jgi:hypothetical protein
MILNVNIKKAKFYINLTIKANNTLTFLDFYGIIGLLQSKGEQFLCL